MTIIRDILVSSLPRVNSSRSRDPAPADPRLDSCSVGSVRGRNDLVWMVVIVMFFLPCLVFAQSAPPPAAPPETAEPAPSTPSPATAEPSSPTPSPVAPSPAPAAPAALTPSAVEKFGEPVPTVTETDVADESAPPPGEDLIYLNATDVDVKDLIKQISKATGTNFLIDDKVRGKVTIISEKPMNREMAYQAFLSALDVMGYTTITTPGGLVKLVNTKDAVSEPVDIYKDETPQTDRFITRIVQVKNISANELSTVVKTLVSKEGNLFAYPATNSLIMTDSGSNIDRILQIIRELDQEGPQEVIEIIPIQHADASDVTEKILTLYEEETQSQRGGAKARPRGRAGGAELEEAPSISKVISDERTNSVIVLGSKRAILKVRGLIARLDTAITGVEGSIHVYYLRHANAKEMAGTLSSLVSGAAPGGEKGKKGGEAPKAGAVELEGGVKVTADESTNSLVITASPKDFQTLIDKVVAKLDIPRRQVYLEAVVMELKVNKRRTLGLSGNFGSVFNLAGNEVSAFGALLPIFPSTISGIAAAAGGLAAGGFSESTIDFNLADGSSVSIPAISSILQALQTDSDVNVLSTPSILTLDNEEAQIQVGSEVPVPAGSTITQGSQTFNVSREDVGVILKITPQISESDTVRLKITQEISNVEAIDPQLGPTMGKKSVQTVVVASNKQTIVIGGLIDDKQTVTTSKVPFLGDVPVLGNLFKNRSIDKTKGNLVVFVTPYIIRDRSDYLEILKKKIEERNIFIDLNYARGQRKQIRETIRLHASELLYYREGAVVDSPSPVSSSSPPPSPPESSSSPTPPPPSPPPTEETVSPSEGTPKKSPYVAPSRRVRHRQRAR